ncbi:MerR family transcriptional regulator [Microbacterium bovistercoris]|uniref:MerR family transcriptional regulator n=1 Tax=Microbacterium bovistercoris TaxID=2293570 RepID=A0A371NZZ8_9MICO|nr:MerR family transcriptional regulator [Microbacterium bovistercoris]REJ08552.1 MerR family transcriptional regulator [Microbacterium bovistercoris]
MKIGEVAERAGVSPRLIRYYEQQSLLRPHREPNGYRTYDEGHVELVRRIAGLVQSGLTTRLVKEILALDDAAALQQPTCPRTVAEMLATELDGIEERIACLSRSRDAIRDYLARSDHATILEERTAARA